MQPLCFDCEFQLRRYLLILALLLCPIAAHAAGGTCPSASTYSIQGTTGTLTALGVTSCYFVSQSTGSDSNNGTTEGTPFANAPGMRSCTSNCASASIAAGTGIILMGGDVWPNTEFGWTWTHSGTSSHPNYIGVDLTWFNATNCGASWCRPVFSASGGAVSSSYYIFLNNGSTAIWTTVDNIEETGWNCSNNGSGTMNGMISPDAEYENMYVHGWSYTFPNSSCQVFAFGANTSNGASQVANSWVHNSVVDGTDQSPSAASHSLIPVGCVLHMAKFTNNVCNTVYNVNGLFTEIGGNLFENFYPGNSGDHCNMTNMQGIFSGSTGYAHDNVYTGMQCSGGLILWLSGNTCSSTAIYYAWNNVIYNVSAGSTQLITTYTHPAQGTSCGMTFAWNNTGQGSGKTLYGNGEASPRAQVYTANNHLIDASLSTNTGIDMFDEGNELSQTSAQANANTTPHFDQYNSSQTYAYSPVASTNSTVTAGQQVTGAGINTWCTNNNPFGYSCPTPTFTGALANGTNDTTYATEGANHTVVMRTVNARGTSWDIGAYQFVAGGGGAANAPTFSPSAGTFTSAQTVTMSTSSGGAIICYTTNGTTPATNGASGCTTGTLYSTGVAVSTTTTIKAIAGGTGFTDSSVTTGVFTMQGATPTYNPVAGTYSSTQNVTISTTFGSVICYSTSTTPATNGTTGCTTGTLYSTPVAIASTSTLKAIAGGTGISDGSVASGVYTITTTVSTPTLTPGTGTYAFFPAVTISTTSVGATICYTTDGSTPTAPVAGTCSGGTTQTYSGPVSVISGETLTAIGTLSGSTNSSSANATYTVVPNPQSITGKISIQGTVQVP